MAEPTESSPGPAPGDDVRAAADLVFRRRAAQLTAALTRVFGLDQLDLVEDVVQDAFVRALRIWPTAGIPKDPAAWLLTVAKNSALDVIRRETRWRDKRAAIEASILPAGGAGSAPPTCFADEIADDELQLIFATCHPALTRDAQVVLTLKTACGFGTAEIARAFLSTQPNIAQRLVRAKRTLRGSDVRLEIPPPGELRGRLDAVLDVVYLLFNEGYSATAGDRLVRDELCAEAVRLADQLAGHPGVTGPHVHALAAFFLFQAARLPVRTTAEGDLLPLEAQDRSRWNQDMIRRGLEHFRRSAGGNEVTTYHLQAEIASCHTLAPSFEETDWDRILACYDDLAAIDKSPVVALNRAVATAHVHGPEEGLQLLRPLEQDPALRSYHRLFAVEAELFWRAGRASEARRAAARAVSLASSTPVQNYLESRIREFSREN